MCALCNELQYKEGGTVCRQLFYSFQLCFSFGLVFDEHSLRRAKQRQSVNGYHNLTGI